jgi:hypothetical protein
MFTDRRIPARTPITDMILSPSIRATMTPLLKGGGSPTVRTDRELMGTRVIPARVPMTAGIGGTALRLPTGRSVISPVQGDRTGILPTSTLATQGAFGGESGGMGAATPTALGPATLTGLGSSVSKIGVGASNTLATFIPLAIKVILAVIVIKIILWLIKRRR